MSTMKHARGPWAKGGEWMAEMRRAQEITASELAEQTGAPSGRYIEEIEAGRRPVPSVMYGDFAQQFGLSSADFAASCLKYYDPKAYEAIFGGAAVQAAPMAAANAA